MARQEKGDAAASDADTMTVWWGQWIYLESWNWACMSTHVCTCACAYLVRVCVCVCVSVCVSVCARACVRACVLSGMHASDPSRVCGSVLTSGGEAQPRVEAPGATAPAPKSGPVHGTINPGILALI